mgnify:CR=1 FL=1
MVDINYKNKSTKLVKIAKKRGMIKKYSEFCNTKEAKEYALSKEEITQYGQLKTAEFSWFLIKIVL